MNKDCYPIMVLIISFINKGKVAICFTNQPIFTVAAVDALFLNKGKFIFNQMLALKAFRPTF